MNMEVILGENMKVDVKSRGQIIKTDQPQIAGGDGTAPAPLDLFFASIAACAGFYAKAFCMQRDISYEGIKISLRMIKNEQTRLVDTFVIDMKLPADFPKKYKAAIEMAVNACAVKKTIAAAPTFELNTVFEEK
ncbi:MAG: OsmC family protein [Bacteroidota bacterium]